MGLGGKLVQKIAKSKLGARIANSSLARKLEQRFENAFSRNRNALPKCVGEPVDVATGKVLNEAIDFELAGGLPLVWYRVWYSTSAHEGALGHGWHHTYDEELYVDEELIILRLPDGRYVGTELLAVGESVFLREEKITLARSQAGYAYQDAAGLTHHFTYCAATNSHKLSQLAATTDTIAFVYSAQGFLAGITDSAGRQLVVVHDQMGRLLRIEAPHPTEPRQRVALVRYAYDEQGHLATATDALNDAWQFRYQGSLLVQAAYKNGVRFYYEYDGVDATAHCTRTWGDEGIYACQLSYDLTTNQTTVIDSVGAQRVYTYDPELGAVTRLVDARGGVTLSEYNEYGELTSITDALGQPTRYTYDERGNCTATHLPDGAQMQRVYDAYNRLVHVTDAVGGQWQWLYTPEGQLAQRIDSLGRPVRYSYQAGRLTTITSAAGRPTTFSYDAAGNLAEVQTSDGQRSRWLYDGWGRVRKMVDARGNVQWREHDLLSQVTTVFEPDGNVRRFAYDALGNVTRAQDRHRDVQYAYRGLGRLIRRAEAGTLRARRRRRCHYRSGLRRPDPPLPARRGRARQRARAAYRPAHTLCLRWGRARDAGAVRRWQPGNLRLPPRRSLNVG
ncbi:MAG: RHS repeat protein [Hymenobacter sp.]|nr:MAG: RHS repeat protein [Hymenobacter sp.]